MTDLVVVLAPSGGVGATRDVLHDWSGAGLLSRFLWVEPGMTTGSTVDALAVDGGRLSAVSLNQLAGIERFEHIRLAVLVPVLRDAESVDVDLTQDVAQLLEESFGGATVSRMRVVITRVGESASTVDLALDGWHNVVLTPEDSVSPGLGAAQLHATTDPVDVGRHAAAGLAGLLGLWEGCPEGPLDHEAVLPGRLVRLARSYYRRLGSETVEDLLRSRVLATRTGLPLPTRAGVTTTYVDDAALATGTMSDQLWERHAAVLRGPREPQVAARARMIGAGEAIRMFFGFLWAALRNAPGNWVARALTRVRAETAAAVHGLVYGSAPSAYEVVVRGVTADGTPASWSQLRDASAELDRALENSGPGREHEVATDMSSLWQEYAAGAFTLADAGERVPWLPPVQIGPQRGVLRAPELVVPSDRASFSDVPAHLVSVAGAGSVAPYDVLGADDLGRRLGEIARRPETGVAAAAALGSLGRWRSQIADAYSTKVGTRLGESLRDVLSEIQTLLRQLQQTASPNDVLAAMQAKQKRLARGLRFMAVAFGLALAVTGCLGYAEIITRRQLVTTLVVLVLGWLVGAFIAFFRGQRDLFQLINARRESLAGEEAAQRNLRHAVRDARRLGQAYGQFLSWSRIIATVLHEPFGPERALGASADVQVSDLPRSVGLGVAEADEATIGSAVVVLRQDLFTVGWLGTCWDDAVAGAYRQLGAAGAELRTAPERIFAERADSPEAILARWAEAVATHGLEPAAGDARWESILELLAGARGSVARSLLATVRDEPGPAGRSVSYERFMGRVDTPELLAPDALNDAVLVDAARSRGASRVSMSRPFTHREGLSVSVCLTQMSEGIQRYEFRAQQGADEPGALGAGTTGLRAGAQTSDLPDIFGGQAF